VAEGWLLLAGVLTLGATVGLGALALSATDGSPDRVDRTLMTFGSALVVLGVLFGEDPPVGFALMAVGVVASLAAWLLPAHAHIH